MNCSKELQLAKNFKRYDASMFLSHVSEGNLSKHPTDLWSAFLGHVTAGGRVVVRIIWMQIRKQKRRDLGANQKKNMRRFETFQGANDTWKLYSFLPASGN